MDNDLLRYKYLPFTEDSLCVLKKGTIKFTAPKDFNDPFDCVPEYDHTTSENYFETRTDLIKEVGISRGLSPAERVQQRGKIIKGMAAALKDKKFTVNLTNNLGICSLSRDPLNLLMWAHYAKNHTGFIVEFSIPQSSVGTPYEITNYQLNWLFPLKVKYFHERPLINLSDDNNSNMEKNFLSKSNDWDYEQEERAIDHIRGPGIHPYDRKGILKSVIVGMRMGDKEFNDFQIIIDAVNDELDTNVKLYRAKPVPGKFALCIPGREDLNK